MTSVNVIQAQQNTKGIPPSRGIIAQQKLFSWEIVEASPEILRLRRVLAVLPDEDLIEALVAERKGRRDDYPVEAVWNSLIAGVVADSSNPADTRKCRR